MQTTQHKAKLLTLSDTLISLWISIYDLILGVFKKVKCMNCVVFIQAWSVCFTANFWDQQIQIQTSRDPYEHAPPYVHAPNAYANTRSIMLPYFSPS